MYVYICTFMYSVYLLLCICVCRLVNTINHHYDVCHRECHIHSYRPAYLLYTSHTCRPPPHQVRSLVPVTINRGAAAPVLHHYHNRPAHARWTRATNVTSVATACSTNDALQYSAADSYLTDHLARCTLCASPHLCEDILSSHLHDRVQSESPITLPTMIKRIPSALLCPTASLLVILLPHHPSSMS